MDKNPASASANFYYGVILLQANRPRKAIPYLLTSTRLHPREPDNYNNLGVAYQMINDTKGAKHYFEQALLLQPDHASARGNLEALLQKNGTP
ncbi:MAG: tetratricopeptide repeat protein [SAR324 cluster bacterium]|nr:tetratricopeptide repeat protein [SAR324 cluster bacterium]